MRKLIREYHEPTTLYITGNYYFEDEPVLGKDPVSFTDKLIFNDDETQEYFEIFREDELKRSKSIATSGLLHIIEDENWERFYADRTYEHIDAEFNYYILTNFVGKIELACFNEDGEEMDISHFTLDKPLYEQGEPYYTNGCKFIFTIPEDANRNIKLEEIDIEENSTLLEMPLDLVLDVMGDDDYGALAFEEFIIDNKYSFDDFEKMMHLDDKLEKIFTETYNGITFYVRGNLLNNIPVKFIRYIKEEIMDYDQSKHHNFYTRKDELFKHGN